MHIAVRDYRRLTRADVTLAPIALVAGPNGAGKTSLLQAVQAALMLEPLPVDGLAKKEAKALVRRGADGGSVRVVHDAGSAEVTWPRCILIPNGDAPPKASAFAAGRLCIVDLPEKERAKALAGYVSAEPTQADLAAVMLDLGYTEKAFDVAWRRLLADGWDKTWANAVEFGAKAKGKWEAATGEKYGDKKAEGWKPEGYDDDWSEEALRRHLQSCQDTLDEALASKGRGIAEAEHHARDVKAGEGIDVAALDKAVTDAQAARAEAQAALDACPIPSGLGIKVVCPHEECRREAEAKISIRNGALHSIVLDKPGVDPHSETAAELRRQRQEAEYRLDMAKRAEETAIARRDAAKPKAEAAAKAAAALAAMPNQGDAMRAIEDARAAVKEAEANVRKFEQRREAASLHAQVARNTKLAAKLAPDGLRKDALTKGLAAFNATLAELAAVAGWEAVRLDEALHVHYGDYPYFLSSESRQLRARVVLQVAMAQADASDAVLIDRADMLDQGGRNGLLRLLKASGLKALVCMTFNKPELVPLLGKAGFGESYWLADGAAVPAAEAAAAKEAA